MKVLIATGIYPPDIGGPATYTKTLEELLPTHKEAGVDFSVSVLPFGSVRHLPKVIRHIAYFFLCLKQAIGVDIIFAQNPVSVGFPAMLVAKILRKRFFVRLGGDYAWEQARGRFGIEDSLDVFACEHNKNYPFFIRLLKLIQKSTVRFAKRVIVPSEYLKKIVSCWGVRKESISVVFNAFGAVVPHVPDRCARKNEIITIGRFVPWKGFGQLIRSMPNIQREVPDAQLTIVGDGPQKEELQQLVTELDLNDVVTFTGALKKEALLDRLVNAKVFVLNTAYEGFSHLLLESFATETPVVTTNVCGNPEVVESEKSGLLYPLGDAPAMEQAIIRMLTDDVLAQSVATNAKKRLQEFSIEHMIAKTAGVLLTK